MNQDNFNYKAYLRQRWKADFEALRWAFVGHWYLTLLFGGFGVLDELGMVTPSGYGTATAFGWSITALFFAYTRAHNGGLGED